MDLWDFLKKNYEIMTTIILLQRPEYTLLMQIGLPGGSKILILRNHSRNKITRVILNSHELFFTRVHFSNMKPCRFVFRILVLVFHINLA